MSPEEKERLFETKHVVSDLKHLVFEGGIMKILSQGFKFAFRVGALVIMARLVTPDDYGVYAMVATLTGLLTMVKDAGLTSATIQRKTITHEEISTLFWVNVAVGAALACLTVALAPVLAWFYGDPRIASPVAVTGLTFLLSGFATQHTALLRRQLRFKALEIIGVASQFAGGVVMLVSAWYGAGYWSMVFNLVALQTANTALVLAAASGWRPSRPSLSTEGSLSMLRFGRDLTGYNLIGYLQRNLDNILIGRYCSPLDLGLYVKAYGLLRVPIIQIQHPISEVVIPALSRLQDDPARYRGYFLKAVKGVVFVGMPLVAFTSIAAREMLLLLLGERWLGAVPIFQALVPAAFLGTMEMIAGWALLSSGRMNVMLRLGALQFVIVAAAFIAGLSGGPIGVAAAYSVAYCLMSVPIMGYALGGSPVTLKDVLLAVWRPATASIAAALLALVLKAHLAAERGPVQTFALEAALYCGAYALAWMLIPGGRAFVAVVAAPALDAAGRFLRRKPALSA